VQGRLRIQLISRMQLKFNVQTRTLSFLSKFVAIVLPNKRQTVQPYLYRGFPALSLNHSTIYTRSSRVAGSMSHGNVTLRPNTASTPTVLTATSSKKTCMSDKTGLLYVRRSYKLIWRLVVFVFLFLLLLLYVLAAGSDFFMCICRFTVRFAEVISTK